MILQSTEGVIIGSNGRRHRKRLSMRIQKRRDIPNKSPRTLQDPITRYLFEITSAFFFTDMQLLGVYSRDVQWKGQQVMWNHPL